MLTVNHIFTSRVGIASLLMIAMTPGAKASSDLWDALKEGGKVVLMRHAPVERGPNSGNPSLRDPSCKREKNLSNQGKRNAERVGRRFTEQRISVSKVMHSPFCRTTDTAHIAFGKAAPAEYLSLLEVLDSGEAAQQTEELSRAIGSYSGDGNLILVTHEPNIRAVSFELMKHLDILVIDPKGGEEFEELGVIRFSESE
jgi:phosphohistidine phosphatase SixA